MKEIVHDIIEDPGRFEVILLPISMYQKKNGESPVPKDSFFSKLVEKYPDLPVKMGEGIEKYGNCPAILGPIPGTRYPTKFVTFPVAPTALRAKDPNKFVFKRLQKRFKPYYLLPGWMLTPRVDVVEFSSYKLAEIIKYYKLTKVALPFEMFTLDRDDKDEYTVIKNVMSKYLIDGVFITMQPKEKKTGTIISTNVQSTVTYDE